jgi:predicted nucleic acid-binding protein
MYVLDTNVLSELRKATGGRADVRVTQWANSVLPENLYLSVVTILELEKGVPFLQRRDPAQSAILRGWIDGYILPAFGNRIFVITTTIAQVCARLHVPDPRPERDALIGATALVHRMTVVTRNVADFAPMGVPVLNPWDFLPASAP